MREDHGRADVAERQDQATGDDNTEDSGIDSDDFSKEEEDEGDEEPIESGCNDSEIDSDASGSKDGSAWSFPDTDGTNWSNIIPRSSWVVPVGNTPYAGSPALVTPRPAGESTSTADGNRRTAALRNLLGEPSGVTGGELRSALQLNGWDMGSALRHMNHQFNEARRREQANQPGRNAEQLERDRLLGADSLHHNRRRAIDLLYERLIAAHPTAQAQLTTLAVGFLLAEN
jgi:hypothetical protein